MITLTRRPCDCCARERGWVWMALMGCVAVSWAHGCGDYEQYSHSWRVDIRLLDKNTGEPLADAEVSIRLLRDGTPYEERDFIQTTNTNGEAVVAVVEGSGAYPSTTGFFGAPVAPPALGPKPDAIEVLVQTRIAAGSVVLAATADNLVGYDEVEGVPSTGYLRFDAVEITLSPRQIPTTYPFLHLPGTMQAIDIDADGDTDLVAHNYDGGNVRALLNDGSGQFPEEREIAEDTPSDSFAAGDVDGDGDLDIALYYLDFSNFYFPEPSLLLLYNDNHGYFPLRRFFPLDNPAAKVQIADLDGDRRQDIFLGITILFNDEAGNFTRTVVLSDSIVQSALGDLDGDGDLDVVSVYGVESAGEAIVQVATNDGRGQFHVAQTLAQANQRPRTIRLADIDGDADLDAIYAFRGSRDETFQLALLKNTGEGTLQPSGVYWGGNSLAWNFWVVDADGDGDEDIVTISTAAIFDVAVRFNDGAGNFPTYRSYSILGESDGFLIADLDSNGILDWAGLIGDRAAAVSLDPAIP